MCGCQTVLIQFQTLIPNLWRSEGLGESIAVVTPYIHFVLGQTDGVFLTINVTCPNYLSLTEESKD